MTRCRNPAGPGEMRCPEWPFQNCGPEFAIRKLEMLIHAVELKTDSVQFTEFNGYSGLSGRGHPRHAAIDSCPRRSSPCR